MVLCPDPGCCAWAFVVCGLLKPHHIKHPTRCPDRDQRVHKIRCAGSGQRVRIDLTRDQHLALLYKAHLERAVVDNRRPTKVHLVPTPPVPPPVCRIGRTVA
jgi:hypothetical protein